MSGFELLGQNNGNVNIPNRIQSVTGVLLSGESEKLITINPVDLSKAAIKINANAVSANIGTISLNARFVDETTISVSRYFSNSETNFYMQIIEYGNATVEQINVTVSNNETVIPIPEVEIEKTLLEYNFSIDASNTTVVRVYGYPYLSSDRTINFLTNSTNLRNLTIFLIRFQ